MEIISTDDTPADSQSAESSVSVSNQPLRESQSKYLEAAQPDNAVEIIPANDTRASSQSAESSNQPVRVSAEATQDCST